MNKLNLPKGDVTFNVWKAMKRTAFVLTAIWIVFSTITGGLWIRDFANTHEFVGFEYKLISPVQADMESEWEK